MSNLPLYHVLADYLEDPVLNAVFARSENGQTVIQLVVVHDAVSQVSAIVGISR